MVNQNAGYTSSLIQLIRYGLILSMLITAHDAGWGYKNNLDVTPCNVVCANTNGAIDADWEGLFMFSLANQSKKAGELMFAEW